MEKTFNKKNIVFGLDIGTRSIVGSVGYIDARNKFNVIAHYSKEHETRAMLDGQIHDISKVSDTILKVKNELEKQVDMPLTEVCIAAAGRVLRTVTVHAEHELNQETPVTSEQIYSLEMMGVENAYEIIRDQEKDISFYCVGYTVVKYYLNDYVISNLEGHKAKKISADVLATFLPDEVVDGLYAAVENVGLRVANLTLEPIAAINIAIPQKYRLLNIALVDVGAGTSDISITKDGSIIAYGMIPRAGDEFTECLVANYLVDFNTAEGIKRGSVLKKQITYKDIMGLKQKLAPQDVRTAYRDTVESVTKEIADKIIELNGGKSVNAVFVVGGGGKVYGFTEYLAQHLDIPKERVALRGEEVLTEVVFEQEEVKKDPLLVTPIGICLSYYEHKNNFVFVNVNEKRIKLYDNDKLTVVDAAFAMGLPNDALFPKRGAALEFYVNGEKRMIRGSLGETAEITINGKPANINSKISKNDSVKIKESTAGDPAAMKISALKEYDAEMDFVVNEQNIRCPRFVMVNGKMESGDYAICNGDKIEVLPYYTLEQLLAFLDIDPQENFITVNNQEASLEDKVYENFYVKFEKRNVPYVDEFKEKFVTEEEIEDEEDTDYIDSYEETVDVAAGRDHLGSQKAGYTAQDNGMAGDEAQGNATAGYRVQGHGAQGNATAGYGAEDNATMPKATANAEIDKGKMTGKGKRAGSSRGHAVTGLQEEGDTSNRRQAASGIQTEPMSGSMAGAPVSNTGVSAPSQRAKASAVRDIVVKVNDTPVRLSGKSHYIFVDVLDKYPFDTRQVAGGKSLIMTVNDRKCDFTAEIRDGDRLQLYFVDR